MYFDFNWRSSLLLIFFFHGLVYALLLFRKAYQQERPSDNWLGLLLLMSILYICPWMLGFAGWYWGTECLECRNFMFYVPMNHTLLMGPAIFLYIRSLLNPSFKFSKIDRWHFVPGITYILWTIVVAVTDLLILKRYYLMDGQNDPDFDTWYQALGFFSLLVYLVLSLRYYLMYRAFIVQELSFADTLQFKWVRNFLIACFLYFFSTVFLDVLRLAGVNIGYQDTWWYYLLFAFLFYYIAIAGYTNSIEQKKKFELDFLRYQMPSLIGGSGLDTGVITEEEASFEILKSEEQHAPFESAESSIPSLWKEKVEQSIVEEKMYRNSELTLTDLANHLGTNPSLLSKIINRSFGKNFNDYVNQYRVLEVKEKLANPANAHLTIMSLAYDAGFNSKATFNRAFKKFTGDSPKTYQIK
ncbi:AraC family transcriptional regulator [Sediminibacterium sp.]|uniref:helix-turn-helix domain-containing protein n=1 Tax=Sediminibacterium sp. TaxID=1917865 RepID=UPI0027349F4A|nr:helix-turn-helix transcriptional regulator [Sediminibacterium sp.]MDP3393226.1 helix-turn-helix transcriptional regulator [Sediminibacterium sp.]MDP3567828.1 helix-turn-helix transcriptional regulator [Sediminibacterium sp.]